jgi:Cu/Ag efflux pump CusA
MFRDEDPPPNVPVIAVEAQTMLPPAIPEGLSADPLLTLLQEIKQSNANFQIQVLSRLTRLEGHLQAARGDIKVIGADVEETKRDVQAVDGKVEGVSARLDVLIQHVDGIRHLGRSTYDMAADLKRQQHGEDSSDQSEDDGRAVAASAVGR